MNETDYAEGIAAEVRAEMARQKKTGKDLSSTLGLTQSTTSRRLTGEVPFDMAEIFTVSDWLGIAVTELDRRVREQLTQHTAGSAA